MSTHPAQNGHALTKAKAVLRDPVHAPDVCAKIPVSPSASNTSRNGSQGDLGHPALRMVTLQAQRIPFNIDTLYYIKIWMVDKNASGLSKPQKSLQANQTVIPYSLSNHPRPWNTDMLQQCDTAVLWRK